MIRSMGLVEVIFYTVLFLLLCARLWPICLDIAKEVITEKLRKCGLSIGENEQEQVSDINVTKRRFWIGNLINRNKGIQMGYKLGDFYTRDLAKTLSILLEATYLTILPYQRRLDFGDFIYLSILGKYMQYSTALWTGRDITLEKAQTLKMEQLCRTLKIYPGLRVLVISSDWGGFSSYLKTTYKIDSTCLVPSEQIRLGKELFPNVQLFSEDPSMYCTKHPDEFDRIICIETEVDYSKVRRALKKDGLFLLETTKPLSSVTRYSESHFLISDIMDLSLHYSATLQSWQTHIENLFHFTTHLKCEDKVYRDIIYHLTLYRLAFQKRKLQLWHILLS